MPTGASWPPPRLEAQAASASCNKRNITTPMPRLLLLFAFCNFVIGTVTFGLSGILDTVSQDLNVCGGGRAKP